MSSIHIRSARADDARDIAGLIAMSSDGVAVIEWEAQAGQRGDNTPPLVIGTEIYSDPDGCYAYTNCHIAQLGDVVAGMLLGFPMPEETLPRSRKTRPSANDANVFAPYMYLEEPDSWYVCGVAAYPEYQGQGIGSRLMEVAEQEAVSTKLHKLSLVVFEENTVAYNWYRRLGYRVIDHAPIVPHPSIPFTGNALLMVKRL